MQRNVRAETSYPAETKNLRSQFQERPAMNRKTEDFLKRCFSKSEWDFLEQVHFFDSVGVETDFEVMMRLIRKAHDYLLSTGKETSRTSSGAEERSR